MERSFRDQKAGERLITTHDIFRFSQKENRLTAQLMLAIEANKDPLLKRFLTMCSLDQYADNLTQIRISLQGAEGESTPDATLLLDSEKLLFIECKLESHADASQLISHVRSGEGRVPVVCISSGIAEPVEIRDAAENLSKQGFDKTLIRWVSWNQIYTELLSLPYEMQEKHEIAGLISSIEKENLSSLRLRAFKQEELSEISQFVKLYPTIFENAWQLVHGVLLYVLEKAPNVEVTHTKPKGIDPIRPEIITDFRYAGMESYNVQMNFDFCDGHVRLAWGGPAKQLKGFSGTQMEKLLSKIKKESLRLELYPGEEIPGETSIPEIIKETQEEKWIYLSRYYHFNDQRLYTRPYEIVKRFGEDILLLLSFIESIPEA